MKPICFTDRLGRTHTVSVESRGHDNQWLLTHVVIGAATLAQVCASEVIALNSAIALISRIITGIDTVLVKEVSASLERATSLLSQMWLCFNDAQRLIAKAYPDIDGATFNAIDFDGIINSIAAGDVDSDEAADKLITQLQGA